MNTFIYRIKTLDGYYFTTSNEEARMAHNMGATVNCGRVTK